MRFIDSLKRQRREALSFIIIVLFSVSDGLGHTPQALFYDRARHGEIEPYKALGVIHEQRISALEQNAGLVREEARQAAAKIIRIAIPMRCRNALCLLDLTQYCSIGAEPSSSDFVIDLMIAS